MERLKAVADSENSFDVLVGIASQFFTQTANVDVECASADFIPVSPYAHEKSFARNNLSGVPYKQSEEIIFFAGEC